jgi:exodeoxyribonuclease-5
LAQTLGAIERRRVQKLLHEVVLLDRMRPDFRPLAVESSESVELGPLILSVRQDRIDFLDDSGRLLIDYKTGQGIASSAWRGVRPAEPQLPLYAATGEAAGIAVIVLNQDGVKLTGVGAEKSGIGGMKTAAEFMGESTTTWEGLLGEWKVNLLALANEFAAGDCRINGLDIKLADGGFAMLTRIHDRSTAHSIEAEK